MTRRQLPFFIAFAVLACTLALLPHTTSMAEPDTAKQAKDAMNKASHHDKHHGSKCCASAMSVKSAVAVLLPTKGSSVHGTVHLKQTDEGVEITAEFTGLDPNAKHAIHIHEFGDVSSDDGTATGGHYNPDGHDHALADTEHGHAGDLGNLETDDDGNAEFSFHAKNVSLAGPNNPVLGRAIIVHAKADDGGQPTGNAGARIAQGVIGIAK